MIILGNLINIKKGYMAGSIFRDRGKCKIQGFYELSSTSLLT